MGKLIIDMLSDTHSQQGRFKCEGGDILLHSGDFTSRGTSLEVELFMLWMADQDYSHKVVIPGNHDWDLEKNFEYWREKFAKNGIHLLNDSGVVLRGIQDDDGAPYEIPVWGSPVQPWFHSWAFNRARDLEQAQMLQIKEIKPHWDLIPADTEILLTHGPAYKILDEVNQRPRQDYDPQKDRTSGLHVGCEELAKRIEELGIPLHVCGHIHEARGFHYAPKTTYVNASSLDRSYYAPDKSKPMRVIREICLDGSIAYVL